jgi:hypothetical protein
MVDDGLKELMDNRSMIIIMVGMIGLGSERILGLI